jgi:hypothetical protein
MEQRHPGLSVKAHPFIKLDAKIMVSNITCEKELVTVVTAVTSDNEDSSSDDEIIAGPSTVTSTTTPLSMETTTIFLDEQWQDFMDYDITELSVVALIGEDSIATAMRVAGISISSTTRIMTWDGLIDYELD